MRDQHALDRQIGKRFERGQQSFGVGFVDEDAHPSAAPGEHVAADERGVLPDEEDDLLRLAVELDRLDAARQLVGGRGVAILRQTALGGVQTEARKRSTKSAVPR
jgi:hypothetical protein